MRRTLLFAGELPQTLELRVIEAEPYAKGDSASTSYIQCTVETGAKVSVPPYVQAGEIIVVDTASGSFVKRASQ
jgi:elongation factor P